VGDILRFNESLYRFEEDRETQCDEEDAVYQGSQCLGALPLTHR